MNDQIRVLVTGSDGFLGRHLVPYLARRGYRVIAASRSAHRFEDPNIVGAKLSDLSQPFDWEPLLRKCDVVIHLAGIAHKLVAENLWDRINHQATAELSLAASCCGIKHLILVSSIAAQSGSSSATELSENDPPRPSNAYGRSKLAAERAVLASGIPFTILRPVVIYGPGEKGNFAVFHRIARLPIPLPFGALTAQRSVLSIENFNSAVETALVNPRARNETFIVSDPTPVNVADLIRRHRNSLGRRSWLVPIPEKWVEALLKAAGRDSMWERLGCPLVALPTKLVAIGWNPTEPAPFRSCPD